MTVQRRPKQRFAAVFTDEVIVHFHDLGGFFPKVHGLLRSGGRMLNKELHFTHQLYGRMTRVMSFANEIYGSTGNYRTLAEELRLTNGAGFEVQTVRQLPRRHYQKTLEQWLANMREHRRELEAMTGADSYRSCAAIDAAEASGDWLDVYVGHGLRAWTESRLGRHDAAVASMARSKEVGGRQPLR